ncbi:protein NLRC5 [Aplochiton taeniatus]
MDDDEGGNGDDVRSVLQQEQLELCEILTNQPPDAMAPLYNLMEAGAQRRMDVRLTPGVEEGLGLSLQKMRALELLKYFSTARPYLCRQFLQTICMICEDVPMRLENRLMSVGGEYTDHWECYKAVAQELLLQRWARVREGLVREVQLDEVWVCRRRRSHIRSSDRPDRTPLPRDRGQRTPETREESEEDRLTVESFLQSAAGRISVLLGHAGSGKTLLMSRLGQDWAQGLGPIPPTSLLLLLGFRQLNLLSSPVSLSQLLFGCGLPPPDGADQWAAVLDYILANPEQCCLVLDGYDEFHSRIGPLQKQNTDLLDPHVPVPVAQLVAGLLSRRLLPGCTLLVTCRPRDLGDLDGVAEGVAELTGLDHRDVREYALAYYQVKGHEEAFRERAVQHLLSDRHLLSMTSLPALCHACCLCLEHLLVRHGGVGEGPSCFPLPTTRTQLYLTILGSYLGQGPGGAGAGRQPPPPAEDSGLSDVGRYRAELLDLSRLALQGLESSRVMFLDHQVPAELLQFSTRTGLLTQEEVRLEDGVLSHAYCFPHLTIQEFLSALRIMSSSDVTDSQLRKMFNLKSRWTTKTERKTVFTDSLHLYLCGLAAVACTPALLLLAGETGPGSGSGPQARAGARVKKRQSLVLKLLRNLAGSTSLTGPKLIELCHCAQETQDTALAREVVGSHSTLELRNIWLSPGDLEALAFVVSSAGVGVGLDIGACSMELECLDVLPRCQYISSLIFRSRKYDNRFAEKLSTVLPSLTTLRRLEFTGANLTDEGAARLVKALQNCPHLAELNLNESSVSVDGLVLLTGLLSVCPAVVEIQISDESQGLENSTPQLKKFSVTDSTMLRADIAKLCLKLVTCSSPLHLDFSGGYLGEEAIKKLVKMLPKMTSLQTLRHMGESFVQFDQLIEEQQFCSLSSSSLGDEGLKVLVDSLPRMQISGSVILDNNNLSQQGALYLVNTLSACSRAATVDVSLVDCAVEGRHLVDLQTVLLRCSLLEGLDLSHNRLGKEGAEFLCAVLPSLNQLNTLILESIESSEEVVELVAEGLLQTPSIRSLSLSGHVISDEAASSLSRVFQSRTCQLTSLDLSLVRARSAAGLVELLRGLAHCVGLEVLHLDSVPLEEGSLICLAQGLGNMTSVRSLNLSENNLSDQSGDRLLRALEGCARLEELHLPGNRLGLLSADRLSQVLPFFPSLSVLDLSQNSFGPEGPTSLSKALLHMANLTKLHLTSIGNSELSGLAASLKHCGKLQDVSLSWNGCGDYVAVELAKVLPQCRKLRKLDLESNSITSRGAESLVRSLQACPALPLTIRLWKNNISISEAQRLTERDGRINFSST